VLLAMFSAIGPGPAVAQEPPVELTWEAPQDCPTADEVRAEIARLLGPSETSRGTIVARAVVVQEGEAFRLELRAADASAGGAGGSRSLTGESCRTVADAAALIVALMIDPEAVAVAQAGSPVVDAPPLAESTPPIPPPAVEPVVPPSPSPPRAAPEETASGLAPVPVAATTASSPLVRAESPAFVGAGIVGDLGSLPGLAFGPSLHGGLVFGALDLRLRLLFLPPRRSAAEAPPTAAGDLWLFAGGVAVCWTPLRARIELGACGGLEGGVMLGEGSGVTRSVRDGAPWIGPWAVARAAFEVTPWLAASVALEAMVPLNRPAFVIEGVGTIHRAGPVVGRLAPALEVRFP